MSHFKHHLYWWALALFVLSCRCDDTLPEVPSAMELPTPPSSSTATSSPTTVESVEAPPSAAASSTPPPLEIWVREKEIGRLRGVWEGGLVIQPWSGAPYPWKVSYLDGGKRVDCGVFADVQEPTDPGGWYVAFCEGGPYPKGAKTLVRAEFFVLYVDGGERIRYVIEEIEREDRRSL